MSEFRGGTGVWGPLLSTIAVTAVIGCVDLLTGRELGFFVFYFAPVGYAGWRLGLGAGIALAIISALVWAGADVLPRHELSHPMIPVWNAIIRLTAFVIIAMGTSSLRRAYDGQEKISHDLSRALSQVKTLEALLPICASCKKIRDNRGQWQVLERYLGDHAGVTFSHGVCPECAQAMVREAGLPEDFVASRKKSPE